VSGSTRERERQGERGTEREAGRERQGERDRERETGGDSVCVCVCEG